jgi:hypothetical protein
VEKTESELVFCVLKVKERWKKKRKKPLFWAMKREREEENDWILGLYCRA